MVRPAAKPAGTRRRPYHHGDLRRALLDEAARTIRRDGIEALTLREVGHRLGVSRTALYRHFTDKAALLAGVAREGFQRLRKDLVEAWEQGGRERAGFDAQGIAYVRFATANPSHYRVMFGAFRALCAKDPELQADAAAAFQALLDALTSMMPPLAERPEELRRLAHFIWATVHGIAMLAIDGQLGPDPNAADALIRFGLERMHSGID